MALPVVVGIDGSAPSLRAVDWAADEAALSGASLRLVHTSLWDRYEPDTTDNPELAEARKAVAELVREASERASARRPGLDVSAEVLPESPVDGLVEAGERASLLVLGHRGHGGFASMLLGSVTLQTAARATCTLIVVRGQQDAVERRHGRIVLGVGGSDGGDPDLGGPAEEFAFAKAAAWGARLEAVHAWHNMPDPYLLYGPGMTALTEARHMRARRLLEAAVADAAAAHPGVRVQLEPRVGGSHAILLEAAQGADLLVVGARRRHGWAGLQLGPVNHAVLHHAPCPVALVPVP